MISYHNILQLFTLCEVGCEMIGRQKNLAVLTLVRRTRVTYPYIIIMSDTENRAAREYSK